MRTLSALSIAFLCWALSSALDVGLEAVSDQAGDMRIPVGLAYLDALAPTHFTAIGVAILVGLIWRMDTRSRSISCEIVVTVISLLLSMVIFLPMIIIVRQYIYLDGPREMTWYRYVFNAVMLLSLGYGFLRCMVSKRDRESCGDR